MWERLIQQIHLSIHKAAKQIDFCSYFHTRRIGRQDRRHMIVNDGVRKSLASSYEYLFLLKCTFRQVRMGYSVLSVTSVEKRLCEWVCWRAVCLCLCLCAVVCMCVCGGSCVSGRVCVVECVGVGVLTYFYIRAKSQFLAQHRHCHR